MNLSEYFSRRATADPNPNLIVPNGPDDTTPALTAPVHRPSLRFMFAHPAHLLALGAGAGLSRIAPGTSGTLWAWAAFVFLDPWVSDGQWAWILGLSLLVGWWACTVTARHMQVLDPGSIVWDEVAAFWLVLWLVCPASLWAQAIAFALFRYFDAAKPGPVRWADQLFHGVNPATDAGAWRKAGLGIMLDDLVAAACTLFVVALWRFI
jgi:phosphatidylglycerophosphatase A